MRGTTGELQDGKEMKFESKMLASYPIVKDESIA